MTLTWPDGDFSLRLYLTNGVCADARSLLTGECSIVGTTRPGRLPGVVTSAVTGGAVTTIWVLNPDPFPQLSGWTYRVIHGAAVSFHLFEELGQRHCRHQGKRESGDQRSEAAFGGSSPARAGLDTRYRRKDRGTRQCRSAPEPRTSCRMLRSLARVCHGSRPTVAQGDRSPYWYRHDEAGGVISGAIVRITSPALIGGELTTTTDERGQLRFPSVPPGPYGLEIVMEGFRPYRDAGIRIGAGATIERMPILTLAAVADSVVVRGSGSRLDARDSGFGTRFGADDLDAIPMRRSSYQDWVKTAPGISPTSPTGSSVLVSAFGSGSNQNNICSMARVSPPPQRRLGGRAGRSTS